MTIAQHIADFTGGKTKFCTKRNQRYRMGIHRDAVKIRDLILKDLDTKMVSSGSRKPSINKPLLTRMWAKLRRKTV